MKKLVISTALVAAATFTFYTHERGFQETPLTSLSPTISYETILGLSLVGNHRLDISKADIK